MDASLVDLLARLFTVFKDEKRFGHYFDAAVIGAHVGKVLRFANHPLFAAGATEPADIYVLRMLVLAYAYPCLFAPWIRFEMMLKTQKPQQQAFVHHLVGGAQLKMSLLNTDIRGHVAAPAYAARWHSIVLTASNWLFKRIQQPGVLSLETLAPPIAAIMSHAQQNYAQLSAYIRFLGAAHIYAFGKPYDFDRDAPTLQAMLTATGPSNIYSLDRGLGAWSDGPYAAFRAAAGPSLVTRMLAATAAYLASVGIDLVPDVAGVAVLAQLAATIEALPLATEPLTTANIEVAKRMMWHTLAYGEMSYFTNISTLDKLRAMQAGVFAWIRTLDDADPDKQTSRDRMEAAVRARVDGSPPAPVWKKKRLPTSPGEVSQSSRQRTASPLRPASSAPSPPRSAARPKARARRPRPEPSELSSLSSGTSTLSSTALTAEARSVLLKGASQLAVLSDSDDDGGGVDFDDGNMRMTPSVRSPHTSQPEPAAEQPLTEAPRPELLWNGIWHMENYGHPFALLRDARESADWWTLMCMAWYAMAVGEQVVIEQIPRTQWTECGIVALLSADYTRIFLQRELRIHESWLDLAMEWLKDVSCLHDIESGLVGFVEMDEFIAIYRMDEPLRPTSMRPIPERFAERLCHLASYIINYSPIVYTSNHGRIISDVSAVGHFTEAAQRRRQQAEVGSAARYATLETPPSVLSSTYVAPEPIVAAPEAEPVVAAAEPEPTVAEAGRDETFADVMNSVWGEPPDSPEPAPTSWMAPASSAEPLLPSPARTPPQRGPVPTFEPIRVPPQPARALPSADMPMSSPAKASPADTPMPSPTKASPADTPMSSPTNTSPSADAPMAPAAPAPPDTDVPMLDTLTPASAVPVPSPSPASSPAASSAPAPAPAAHVIDTAASLQSLLDYARTHLPQVIERLAHVGVDRAGQIINQPAWKLVPSKL